MKHTVKNIIQRILSLQICSVVVACTFVPVQLSAQSLQRIFSTPEIRAELDRLRFQIASGVVIEAPEEEPLIDIPIFSGDEEEIVYALGGSLLKADGSYTVWINDVAYDQSNLPGNMELRSPFSQGQLRIRDSGSGANYDVKPGQVLNLTTGQLYESYQYQAVLEAAAAEAARLAMEEAANSSQGVGIGTGSAVLDSAAVSNLLDAAQDL
ncbi:MAG: hypothetical protein COB20_00145 [SAR86 cluster bacterium]|uniref:Uncharacterized protein n=1 Tax=SAR86 cluster bacterium TaxID=2030880 RepID=A0A2A4XIE2_9GAMM|nr:MAG: hypothetical protein COB20_00145 [SAR86 cluster bacterium]